MFIKLEWLLYARKVYYTSNTTLRAKLQYTVQNCRNFRGYISRLNVIKLSHLFVLVMRANC